jgi:hypothetical protein
MNPELSNGSAGLMFLSIGWLGDRTFMSSSNQLSGVRHLPSANRPTLRPSPDDERLPIRKSPALTTPNFHRRDAETRRNKTSQTNLALSHTQRSGEGRRPMIW